MTTKKEDREVAVEVVTNSRGEPDVIWLQVHGDADPADYDEPADVQNSEVTWCWEPLFDHDVKYIRADLAAPKQQEYEPVAWHPVIAELREHMRHCVSAADEGVDYAVSREMLDALTTLRLMEKCGRGKWRPTEYGERFANTAQPGDSDND